MISSAKSKQITRINGNTHEEIEWRFTLTPRHRGKITLPTFQFGQLKTTPLILTVTKAIAQSHQKEPIFLEVQAEPKKAVIQSQILYTVRLFISKPLQNASLTDPISANTIILRQGIDQHYRTLRNGHTYEVIERKYSLFPQKSGSLTISPPTFIGEKILSTSSDLFFPDTQTIRLIGKPIQLTIEEKPSFISNADWLPAQEMSINESWSSKEITIGDPITRIITINAIGLSGEQLPELNQLKAPGFNLYPDKPKINTTASNKAILGQRILKITYIPMNTGELIIPLEFFRN